MKVTAQFRIKGIRLDALHEVLKLVELDPDTLDYSGVWSQVSKVFDVHSNHDIDQIDRLFTLVRLILPAEMRMQARVRVEGSAPRDDDWGNMSRYVELGSMGFDT